MIDFEEGRISVRLSEGTYYLLQRDIAKFCFVSNDGSYNENGFYNTVLPSLHENRLSERFALRKILEKRFANKVKPEFKEELFCEMDDVFNIVQFEDKGTKYHQAKIDIRLSKENMKKFSGVFSLLKTQEIPKSAYIRNLLNQYTAMRIDEREYLCYKREYEDLMQVVNEGLWLEYKTGQIVEDIFVMDVDLCCYDNEFYVVGIVFDEGKTLLKSYRLCEFKQYKIKHNKDEIAESLLIEANEAISNFCYYKNSVYHLRGYVDEIV